MSDQFLLGLLVGIPTGFLLNEWLRFRVIPVLIRHGWK